MRRIDKLFLSGFFMVIILISYLFLWEPITQKYTSTKFFDNLIEGNFNKASTYVYFYDETAPSLILDIDIDKAKHVWVKRMEKLRDNEVYLHTYRKLDMKKDDGELFARVSMTLMVNDEKKDIEVAVFYYKTDLQKGITRIDSITSLSEEEKEWIDAISGFVRQEAAIITYK